LNYFNLEQRALDRAVVLAGSAVDAAFLIDSINPGLVIKIDAVLLAEVGARSAFTTFIRINAHLVHVIISIYPFVK
jgi:hypothetical protein